MSVALQPVSAISWYFPWWWRWRAAWPPWRCHKRTGWPAGWPAACPVPGNPLTAPPSCTRSEAYKRSRSTNAGILSPCLSAASVGGGKWSYCSDGKYLRVFGSSNVSKVAVPYLWKEGSHFSHSNMYSFWAGYEAVGGKKSWWVSEMTHQQVQIKLLHAPVGLKYQHSVHYHSWIN